MFGGVARRRVLRCEDLMMISIMSDRRRRRRWWFRWERTERKWEGPTPSWSLITKEREKILKIPLS